LALLLVLVQPNSTRWRSYYYRLYLYQQEYQLLPNCTRKCVINYTNTPKDYPVVGQWVWLT